MVSLPTDLVTYLVSDDCMSCRAATRANKVTPIPDPGASTDPGASPSPGAGGIGLVCDCSLLLVIPLITSVTSVPTPPLLTRNESGPCPGPGPSPDPGPGPGPSAIPDPGADAITTGLVCTSNKHLHT